MGLFLLDLGQDGEQLDGVGVQGDREPSGFLVVADGHRVAGVPQVAVKVAQQLVTLVDQALGHLRPPRFRQ